MNNPLAQPSEVDQSENNKPKPTDLRSPGRGAIPTPRSEVERAKPYIIEDGSEIEDKLTS